MSKLYNIIQELKNESSTNKKVEILQKYKEDEDLQALFKGALDGSINYYLRGNAVMYSLFPDPHSIVPLDKKLIEEVIGTLNGRRVTGNAARVWIQSVADKLEQEDQELLKKMLDRDLDCKVGITLTDRVWKDLIYEYPCLLASKFDAKLKEKIEKKYKGSFIAQLKADGGRCNAHVTEDSISFFSRNGKELLMHGVFDEYLNEFNGYVLDGELLVLKDGSIKNRQTGNGIFNKAVRGTITKDEAETFHFVVWDLIPIDKFKQGKDETPYNERYEKLKELVEKNPHNLKISLIETKFYNTLDECIKYAEDKIDEGQEGAIIKIHPLIWENKHSADQFKIKEEKEGDFLCTGTIPHNKNPELIGSLIFETSDGIVKFNCGSGLTDEDRAQPADYFVGNIFTVYFNSIIKSKDSDKISLFLPVRPTIRLDKTIANTYQEIK